MASIKPTLSVREWLGVLGGLFRMIFLVITALVLAPFQSFKTPPSFFRRVAFSFVRALCTSFSPKEMIAVSPTTDEVYQKYVVSKKLKADTVTLPDGTRAHWLGDPSADKVLLYFHGGGYLMYPTDAYFRLLQQTIAVVEKQGGKLAVLFLSYDISYHAPYPRQLQQASSLLNHVLTVLKKKPEDILIVGDSAGGNLALALLSHILHPHPQVDPVTFDGQLAGVSLLSPWVTFKTTAPSMTANQYCDVLVTPTLNRWAALFQGAAASDYYIEPLSAPATWWEGLPAKRVQILAGGDEMFVDDIESFAGLLGPSGAQVVMNTVVEEAHGQLVLEFAFREERSQQRELFERWVVDVACQ